MLNTLSYMVIDQIQSGKKEFVSKCVKNAPLAAIFNTFIDTQSEYTQSAAKLSNDSMTAYFKLIMSPDTYKVK